MKAGRGVFSATWWLARPRKSDDPGAKGLGGYSRAGKLGVAVASITALVILAEIFREYLSPASVSSSLPSSPLSIASQKQSLIELPFVHPVPAAAAQPSKHDFVWESWTNDVTFARLTQRQHSGLDFSERCALALSKNYYEWTELSNTGEERFFFIEKTAVIGSLDLTEFELFDCRRQLFVKVTSSETQLKWMTDAAYSTHASGRWTMAGGVATEKKTAREPKPIVAPDFLQSASIYVGIAAYRDPLCGNTLKSLFANAKHPDRVSVGVVQQNDAKVDVECLADYCLLEPKCRRSQVKVMQVDLELSRGVMPARFRQHLMMQDQEFCLQIDAHMEFEVNWDEIALSSWHSTGNEMAVLTTYPNAGHQQHDQSLAPSRCSTMFQGDGFQQLVAGGGAAHNVPPGKTPYRVAFFGAGVAFSKCHADHNVPYDPYMPFLFKGEEFNRAARLFTHGYELYSPNVNFVYHWYPSEEKPPHLRDRAAKRKSHFESRSVSTAFLTDETIKRWRNALGLPISSAPLERSMENSQLFGIGHVRSLSSFLGFAGVDFQRQILTSRCNRIGHMEWVPYDFDAEHFNPLGPDCPAGTPPSQCCTTLNRARKAAEAMLAMTSDEMADVARASKRMTLNAVSKNNALRASGGDQDWQHPREPAVNPMGNAATKGACV